MEPTTGYRPSGSRAKARKTSTTKTDASVKRYFTAVSLSQLADSMIGPVVMFVCHQVSQGSSMSPTAAYILQY